MNKINLITPEDIETYNRIDRDCLAMHVCPPPKTFINMKVHDASGDLTLDLDMPSRSWVRNAYNSMAHMFLDLFQTAGSATFGEGSLSVKHNGGTVYRETGYKLQISSLNSYQGIAGAAYSGIAVGTSDAAESLDNFSLNTLIAHGTTAGKLNYNAQTNQGGTYTSGTKKWSNVLTRVFDNSSGGDIAVKEVGLIAFCYYNSSATYFLFARDLLPEAVTVANGAHLTVTYTIEMTFPG